MTIDRELLSYATEQQAVYINAVLEHGSARSAAAALGVHHSTIGDSIKRCKNSAAQRGYAPEHNMTNPVSPMHVAARVSSHFTKGVLDQQWVIATLDEQKAQAARAEALVALAETLPRLPALPAPASTNNELCNVYTLTDCHVGMLAWGKECGEDWDLKIAEATLVGCFERMVANAPPAKIAYVNQLGDFLHTDSMQALTPASGHLLDADGRQPKIVEAAIRILRKITDFALLKHDNVYVLMAEGNHDPVSSMWLRAMWTALYENEPRVTVVNSEFPYYAHQHGVTMLAFHHGHLKKPESLPLVFASAFPKLWGATTHRYCHTGHRHHKEEKEHSGMTTYQHPTLSAKDAYSSRGGWFSMRSVTAVTYHAKFGEVGRTTVTPEML